ncbi:MAG: hypothetical protein Unbinned6354contig1000_48 [Prokaryotic dsDNA virus sp.]|nr:MAG: hypothetical protein Unbinned6354contig1000_48 [Prokaryotic dsDNA virus sp.]|tara:strand:- start:4827 stop:6338 length:1512 start_codon:yes stop_codon:yes gene_type:complete
MNFKPHDYQHDSAQFVINNPISGLFADCGVGKTAITLHAINELADRAECKGVLIVAPLRVSRIVWPLEIYKWDNFNWMTCQILEGGGLPVSNYRMAVDAEGRPVLSGAEEVAAREEYELNHKKLLKEAMKRKASALKSKAFIFTINYEGLMWLGEVLKKTPVEKWPFDTLVWDELTKMKSPSSKRFKRWKRLVSKFDRVIGLTGTPVPKSIGDLFGQICVLDGGERLGTSFTAFQDRYFYKEDYMGYHWVPHDWAEEKINEKIHDIIHRVKAADHLDTPPATVRDLNVKLSTKNRKEYDELEKQMFLDIEGAEIEALNAASLMNKCVQYAAGSVYYGEGAEWVSTHDRKIEELKRIQAAHKGQPLLVAYSFKHEAEKLRQAFPEAEFLKSGMTPEQEQDLQRRWDAGLIKMLVCHPASAGHGLNLQYGGHIAVWLTLNWSLELYLQFNKRVDRQGQTIPPIIYRIITENTVDEVIASTLEEKEVNQIHILKALELYKRMKEGV